MAEDIAKAAVEAGSKAVMDLSLSAGAFSISLKIDNVWLAGAVSVGALSLGAFYLACKGPTEGAIRRALERKIFGVEDPAVMNITGGHSILVELRCSTESSFLVLFEDLETNSAKFRLEEEFKKIGFKSDLDVTIRNAETVYKHVSQIRGRYRAEREVWKQKYEELANMVNRMHENVALAHQANDTQTSTRADETLNRVQQLEAYFSGKAQYGETGRQGPDDSKTELDCVQEKLRREMAISMGMRRTIERLQEENKRLQSISERVRNDGMELKDQVKTRSEENRIEKRVVLELREKVHELEKENELLQQKLKRKDKELERFQSTETDVIVPESRPRASSGTSLGASSGYQSEEDPDESSLEIIQMPRSQAIQEGKTLVLSCRTRGLPDVRYRWVKDDVEIPGANRPDLVLEPVRMQDFGRYVCRVWDKTGSATSEAAEIDIFPGPKKRFRGLHEMDTKTKKAIVDLLSKKRLPGLATWKQVARRYAMRETEISLLEMEKIPAGAMFERLTQCLSPNLTVYYLCKTFKESGLKRLDAVDLLSKEMLIAA